MRIVSYSLGTSLDGYIIDSEGSFNWSAPGPEEFRFATDEVRGLSVHLMGRRLYETMLYWENAAEEQDLDEAELEFAELWNALPKVVFSSTLTSVVPSARLATGTLAEEIARLRAESEEGEIGIGGAELAAAAAAEDLIDEYRPRVQPFLVGGGVPFFPQQQTHRSLELLASRLLDNRVMHLRYRVVR